MIAGQSTPDAIDRLMFRNIFGWVALEWSDKGVRPPKGQAYGTHLATYLHCDRGQEIRGWNACWLVESAPGQYYRAGDGLHGIDTIWFFKYSTLRKFRITEFHGPHVAALDLPDPGLDKAVSEDVRQFRDLRQLDDFRHPGYPDDVAVSYGRSINFSEGGGISPEQVWVRINRFEGEERFQAELLNQPQIFPGALGDNVTVHMLKADSKIVLYAPSIELMPS